MVPRIHGSVVWWHHGSAVLWEFLKTEVRQSLTQTRNLA